MVPDSDRAPLYRPPHLLQPQRQPPPQARASTHGLLSGKGSSHKII
jgi:hypothetical protein